jgi:hypothetical protein
MPGNVAAAAPVEVMPRVLCAGFERSQQWSLLANGYANGEHEAASGLTNSRRTWSLQPRLTPTQVSAVRAFYEDRRGPLEPFYFYDAFESGFIHDPTGVETAGRYTVRFAAEWQHTTQLGRMTAAIALIEIR